MKRLLPKLCLLLALVALVALAVLPVPVGAEKHMKASGKIEFGAPTVLVPPTPIDGYAVYADKLSGKITGDMESSNFLFIRTLIIHGDDFEVTGQITGTATIFGRSGGFTMRITGTGIWSTKAIQGEYVLLGGTGGLAGLRGQGTFSGIAGVASDYSSKIYFDK